MTYSDCDPDRPTTPESRLRTTIEEVLSNVHIESGRKDEWERVVDALEAAITLHYLGQASTSR